MLLLYTSSLIVYSTIFTIQSFLTRWLAERNRFYFSIRVYKRSLSFSLSPSPPSSLSFYFHLSKIFLPLFTQNLFKLSLHKLPLAKLCSTDPKFLASFLESFLAQWQVTVIHRWQKMMKTVQSEIGQYQKVRVIDHRSFSYGIQL